MALGAAVFPARSVGPVRRTRAHQRRPNSLEGGSMRARRGVHIARVANPSGDGETDKSFLEVKPVTLDPPSNGAEEESGDIITTLKLQVLAAVASLDRGIAATPDDEAALDALASRLAAAAPAVVLSATATPKGRSELSMLGGLWRLVYSSGFASGSLGGRRPGPPAAIFPPTLGQVYQRINAQAGTLDNIVEFFLPLPEVPFLPKPPTPLARITLGHTYTIEGVATVKIVFEDTAVDVEGGILDDLPQLQAPQLPDALKPPSDIRSATFDVVFLDGSMRITRGDRGELRIYLRDDDALPSVPPMMTVDSLDIEE